MGGGFRDGLSYGGNYLALNGPSKTLSEIFRRSFGLSRACNFSGSNSSFFAELPQGIVVELLQLLPALKREWTLPTGDRL
jgi:hypothetical protein